MSRCPDNLMKYAHIPVAAAAAMLFTATLGIPRSHAVDASVEEIAPIKAPFDMPQLQRPKFPDHTARITEFGAVEGGSTKNTEAFKRAIAAVSEKGGGRVVVPPGKWLTGPIHLKSNINLHMEDGAEIIFSDQFEDYLPPVFVRAGGIEIYNYSPLVYARDCENIAITGAGFLNGNAKAWWAWARKESREPFKMGAEGVPVEKRVFGTPEAAIRPSFVGLVNCQNVLLEGFKIGSGPNWTIHPIYCENLIIRRVSVDTHGPNNDGIDPDSCRNVLVEHCTFNTGDDCLVLKSGYNQDGWRVGKPTENVVMRHCYSNKGHGGLVIGSEMSGSVRNVYMHDCEFDGTDRVLRIKSRIDRGGVVENVWVENVKFRNLQRDAVILNMDYGSDRQQVNEEKPPVFRNIQVKDMTGAGAPVAITITGIDQDSIRDIHFENMTITAQKGAVIKNAREVVFAGVHITPAKGPVFDLTNVSGVIIRKATAPDGVETFLKVEGAGSGNIVIGSTNLSAVQTPVRRGEGVPETAVKIE
jgi:polygalacturonase